MSLPRTRGGQPSVRTKSRTDGATQDDTRAAVEHDDGNDSGSCRPEGGRDRQRRAPLRTGNCRRTTNPTRSGAAYGWRGYRVPPDRPRAACHAERRLARDRRAAELLRTTRDIKCVTAHPPSPAQPAKTTQGHSPAGAKVRSSRPQPWSRRLDGSHRRKTARWREDHAGRQDRPAAGTRA